MTSSLARCAPAARHLACVVLALIPAALLPRVAVADDALPPYRDTRLGVAERAADLVRRLTLAEKVAQLQDGAPGIARLGLPAYGWWNEGLHGLARNGQATVFPQAIGLAASWDAGLLRAVGGVIADEARAKSAEPVAGASRDGARYTGLTIWAPNINLFRDPRWGRGQETYGEDPALTARLGVAFVQGLQGPDAAHPRVVATPKHFAVHSGPERNRHEFDVTPSPRDLEESYLPAFRAAVTEGRAGSIMCAYNALAGTPACANGSLLQQRLRDDWGFGGFVVTDCDAIEDMTLFHKTTPDDAEASARALQAGTDLNCGKSYAALTAAVASGRIREVEIDRSLRRLFEARLRLGLFAAEAAAPTRQPTQQDTRALALRAARESMVLLKNDGVLPLSATQRIAVVGPTAELLENLQANYHGTARHPVTPLAGLRAAFGAARVRSAQGASLAENMPVAVPQSALRTPDGRSGLRREVFANASLQGQPMAVAVDATLNLDFDRTPAAAGLPTRGYSVRWRGQLLPPAAGDYRLGVRMERCFDCAGHDRVRLYLDGRLLQDGETDQPLATLHFADRQPHAVRIEWLHTGEDQGITLQWQAPAAAQIDEAVAAAARADVVVAFVGLSPNLEGEQLQVDVPGFDGGDRRSLDLPAPQEALLRAVKATGKPLVVVLQSGSAVAIRWAAEHADAVLAAWYPGEVGGQAIADTLLGRSNPAGRLPVTFYRSADDLPAFDDYRMQGRTYRYFTGTPLWPFGHGLSYTRFGYGDAAVSTPVLPAGQTLQLQVEVQNSGARDGDEVVQVYLEPPPDAVAPRHALVAFQRVHLKTAERRTLRFALDARALSVVGADGVRAVEPGRYALAVGGGQPGHAPILRVSFDARQLRCPGAPGDAAMTTQPPTMTSRRRLLQSAVVGALPLAGCAPPTPPAATAATAPDPAQALTQHVDLFIGTGGHGHTSPAATLPFGMVQLGPDTDNADWDACSGYHDSGRSLMGFSHTHLSGTGIGDLLDVLVMPCVGEVQRQPGPPSSPERGWRAPFTHADQHAEPGYYRVALRDRGVTAELTATQRTGLHRYTFPASRRSHLMVDLRHGMQDKPGLATRVTWAELRFVGNDTLMGGRAVNQWAQGRHIYFAMQFSRPFERFAVYSETAADGSTQRTHRGAALLAALHWNTAAGEPLLVKCGISAVSAEGALRNLQAEQPGWDFDRVRTDAHATWQRELERLQLTTFDPRHQRMLYTALYHSLLAPTLFNDVDGQYRGMDLAVHRLPAGASNYTQYSLWDTYRSLHPLLTLLQPERVPDLVNTLVRMAEQSPQGVPVWPLQGRETGCMIGYHSAVVLAEAQSKNIPGIDFKRAWPLWRRRAMDDDYRGLPLYRRLGFIPSDQEEEATSKTLEYAYDDWALAHLARGVGAGADHALLRERSRNYRNVFDPALRFVRPRLADGRWAEPFDPRALGHSTKWHDFTESNAWQATFLNQHDVAGCMQMFGGQAAFVEQLDALFTTSSEQLPGAPPDISGLIGQYAHGNEPSHHVAYLYAYAGQPWKTQARVRQIMETLYSDRPDGLSGNEDCGQMSAWLLLSALGLYPVDPVSARYVFGSPLVQRAQIRLAGGQPLVIEAQGNGPDHRYVQSVSWQGRPHERSWIDHASLMRGGRLVFVMGPAPNPAFGAAPEARPPAAT